MEITTAPLGWRDFLNGNKTREERAERASRTNVIQLDYLTSDEVVTKSYKTSEGLRTALEEQSKETDTGQRAFRLFVVEDLSRDVIELLGTSFDIEPAFSGDQILDYAWYNVRDRWMNPPALNFAIRRQRWVQLRFVTARYFKTVESFRQASQEAQSFNVLRRPEDDLNNKAIWDEQGGVVGLSRARASFWLSNTDHAKPVVGKCTISFETTAMADGDAKNDYSTNLNVFLGVLLVDPTIKDGFPLWYDYLNWEGTLSIHDKKPARGPPRSSLFDDVVYWAQKLVPFSTSPSVVPSSKFDLPLQALLQLVCSKWLTLSEYIKTRLAQIEWELTFPEHFLNKSNSMDGALRKLHIWRRLVPLYCEMLRETLQRVFQLPCHTSSFVNGGLGLQNMSNKHNMATVSAGSQGQGRNPLMDSATVKTMEDDFTRIHSYMEEYDRRIDPLASVVAAVISIDESKIAQEQRQIAQEESQSISGRFIVLAAIFLPLSFIASLFSMQDDIGQLGGTMKWYFISGAGFFFLCWVVLYLPKSRYFRWAKSLEARRLE